MSKKVLLLLFMIMAGTSFAQIEDYSLGNAGFAKYNQQSGFFDFSDETGLNIKVSLWGWVKYPGQYLVPEIAFLVRLGNLQKKVCHIVWFPFLP